MKSGKFRPYFSRAIVTLLVLLSIVIFGEIGLTSILYSQLEKIYGPSSDILALWGVSILFPLITASYGGKYIERYRPMSRYVWNYKKRVFTKYEFPKGGRTQKIEPPLRRQDYVFVQSVLSHLNLPKYENCQEITHYDI